MGCNHSTSAPTEQDLLFQHHDEAPAALLCAAFIPVNNNNKQGFFELPHNSWKSRRVHKKKSGHQTTSVVVEGGGGLLQGVRVVSHAETGRAVVFHNSKPLAVLIVPEEIPPHADAIRAGIYGLEPSTPKSSSTITPSSYTHNGQALFEWAVVSKRKNSNLHVMTTTDGNEKKKKTSYTTEYFGGRFTRNKLVVKKQGQQQQQQVCASLQLKNSPSLIVQQQQQQQKTWHCCVNPGIDPVLMVCFVACLDRLVEAKLELLEHCSYRASYMISGILK